MPTNIVGSCNPVLGLTGVSGNTVAVTHIAELSAILRTPLEPWLSIRSLLRLAIPSAV